MPGLYVRNVPEDLYQRIQESANTHKRSISAEVIHLLQLAVREEEARSSQARLLLETRANRMSPLVGTPDSVAMLREDRAR
jgi:plasmid stability protein